MNRVVISVGSNICPEENIIKAKERIDCEHKIIAESCFVITKPIGYFKQPDFLNGVIFISTKMDREELKNWLIDVENDLGRKRVKNKYAPRVIDLDIVVWNGKVVNKDVYERDFLRDAILEVIPELNI